MPFCRLEKKERPLVRPSAAQRRQDGGGMAETAAAIALARAGWPQGRQAMVSVEWKSDSPLRLQVGEDPPPRPAAPAQTCVSRFASDTHMLHFMQWWKSMPKPWPLRQTLQKGQWYVGIMDESKSLQTPQWYAAAFVPQPPQTPPTGPQTPQAPQSICSTRADSMALPQPAASWHLRQQTVAPQQGARTRVVMP